ncbi:hypothetical protein [Erythrobacter sp. CCH5-A1]|jgi:hypothetical protein|uniref:hypothetical protein n=1 Tax=Erythrobacter sp. CCH5-A1 TaxID=1768792 RepID=UPI0008321AA8|nr:hypothetical protein [Erythrobacter sp. CCH5-A1]
MQTIDLILSAEREISFRPEQLEALRISAPAFPFKLDDASAKALQNRLKALRRATTEIRFSIAGLSFHQIPPSSSVGQPKLIMSLDGDDSNISFSPDRADVLHDMIIASNNKQRASSILECPVFSRVLNEERNAAKQALWLRESTQSKHSEVAPLEVEFPDEEK